MFYFLYTILIELIYVLSSCSPPPKKIHNLDAGPQPPHVHIMSVFGVSEGLGLPTKELLISMAGGNIKDFYDKQYNQIAGLGEEGQ